MRPKAEYWAIYDAIVVTDKRGSRSYTVEEANDLSDELRHAVREAKGDDGPAPKSYVGTDPTTVRLVGPGVHNLPPGKYTMVVSQDGDEAMTEPKWWERASLDDLSKNLNEIDNVPMGVLWALKRLLAEAKELRAIVSPRCGYCGEQYNPTTENHYDEDQDDHWPSGTASAMWQRANGRST